MHSRSLKPVLSNETRKHWYLYVQQSPFSTTYAPGGLSVARYLKFIVGADLVPIFEWNETDISIVLPYWALMQFLPPLLRLRNAYMFIYLAGIYDGWCYMYSCVVSLKVAFMSS